MVAPRQGEFLMKYPAEILFVRLFDPVNQLPVNILRFPDIQEICPSLLLKAKDPREPGA
jgi:hypothetical protein